MAIESELHGQFCSQLKLWRRYRGLSQTDLAERMGITQPMVAQLESGRNTPGLDTVDRFATAT